MGYHRAGFGVVGVDHLPQKHYPFEFHQADALEYVARHGHEYDAIHASPPCQKYSVTRSRHPHIRYPDLIASTRQALSRSGRPYVIENVRGAPLARSLMLCGAMFGLRVYRHRWFEASVLLFGIGHPRHKQACYPQHRRGATEDDFITVTGDSGQRLASLAMGIDWMTGNELSQAIPPAYTEYLGTQLRLYLEAA